MSTMNEDGIQQETLPFLMNELPLMYMKKAEKELNESQQNLTLGLRELKEMARVNKMTCEIEFVDDFLLQFLRHRKNDIPRAFKQLVNFTNYRKRYSYLFESINENIFRSQCRQYLTFLPRRCPDGCAILLCELGKWDPEKMSFEDFKRGLALIFSQSLRDPMTQVNGYKIIHDFTNTSVRHLRYCTPHNMYLMCHGGIDCFPARYKGIHLVSNSLTMKAAWAVCKHFVTQKLKNRIFLDSSPEDLLKYFPPSVLPVQYGGVLKDYHLTEWMEEANEQQVKFALGGQTNYY